MRIVKIASACACTIGILVVALAFTVKNPETELYEKTVEMLMRQEGMSSHQEMEEHFPELLNIKSKMNRISYLNQIVLSKTRSPAPTITEGEALQMAYYTQRIRQLRRRVRTELSQLIATYAESRSHLDKFK